MKTITITITDDLYARLEAAPGGAGGAAAHAEALLGAALESPSEDADGIRVLAEWDGATPQNPVPDWWEEERIIAVGGEVLHCRRRWDGGEDRSPVECVAHLPSWVDDAAIARIADLI